MRQEDVSLGEAMCPSLLAPCPLPSMWQLYPGRRYRGSDSSFWRIVYHIEASVSFWEPLVFLGGLPLPAPPPRGLAAELHPFPSLCTKAKQGKDFALQVLNELH